MADFGSFDYLYSSSSFSSTKKIPSSSFKTLHIFLLIGFTIMCFGFAAFLYNLQSYQSPLTPNFCINPTDSNAFQENEGIHAPNFCIVPDGLELSEFRDNDDTEPPIFSIKSMKVSVPFLSKEADDDDDQVWNITMSIENPNLGADISYDQGVVYVYYGDTELWKTDMNGFNQTSWGYRLSHWRYVSSKSLTNSSVASSIRYQVARDGYVVFRVLVRTMIKVHPSSYLEKDYLLLVDCDGLKVDFPSGTISGGGRRCSIPFT